MQAQAYQTDNPSEGFMAPQTDEEQAFQDRAMQRFLRRECSYCGEPRPIDDVLCTTCRASLGLLRESRRREEGGTEDRSRVVPQVLSGGAEDCPRCGGLGIELLPGGVSGFGCRACGGEGVALPAWGSADGSADFADVDLDADRWLVDRTVAL